MVNGNTYVGGLEWESTMRYYYMALARRLSTFFLFILFSAYGMIISMCTLLLGVRTYDVGGGEVVIENENNRSVVML